MPAIDIRDERPEDASAVADLNRAAFAGEEEAAIVARLRRDNLVAVALVATVESGIIGHIVLSWLPTEMDNRKLRALALAPMAVAPAYQRQGVGSRLVDAAIAAAKAKGVKAVPLAVSAPFHSPLMQPAAEAMAEALARIEIGPLATPLVANITAAPVREPNAIRDLLVRQVTGRVRWRESVEWMAKEGGVARFVEIGAGKQLTGMVKRNAPDAEALALNEPGDLEAFAKMV